jgi:hypothetical protein
VKPLPAVAVLSLLLVLTGPGRAEMVSYTFQGTAYSSYQGASRIGVKDYLPASIPMSGSLNYDTNIVWTGRNTDSLGNVVNDFSTTGSITFSAGGYSRTTDPSSPLSIALSGPAISFYDHLPGSPFGIFFLEFERTALPTFSSTSLPERLSLQGDVGFFHGPIWSAYDHGTIDSIQEVVLSAPEPAASALLCSGVLALALFGLRIRRCGPWGKIVTSNSLDNYSASCTFILWEGCLIVHSPRFAGILNTLRKIGQLDAAEPSTLRTTRAVGNSGFA